jgi:hypothetical protein
MNGFIPRTALGIALCISGLAGCACYRTIVDPCWPERYNYIARGSVNEANNAQAYNGHVLDQTIWNYDFEHDAKTGLPTAVLNPAGIERLKYLSRRRPVADCHIYLATAQDLPNLAELPAGRIVEMRNDLNARRIAAIQNFLVAQTNGRDGFTIDVHDPAEVGIDAIPIAGTMPPGLPLPQLGAFQKLQNNFQGVFAGPPSVTMGVTGGGGGGGGPR